MRVSLAIGVLVLLFFGTVHSEPLEVWLSGSPVCKMACAKTADCCCKRKRQRDRESSRRDGTTIVVGQPDRQCCPTHCATANTTQRSVPSDPASRVGWNTTVPRVVFRLTETTRATCRGLNGAPRPRAPPPESVPA